MSINILYQDNDMAVCEKPAGLLTLPSESDEKSLLDVLCEQLSTDGKRIQLYPVHRLDRLTAGVVVFAKNKRAAAELSSIFAEHKNEKQYLCIVHGDVQNGSEECTDLIFADKRQNKSYVTDKMRKGVKEARLYYERLAIAAYREKPVSLLRVSLYTGRMHQIRAQLSHRHHPLLGDGKYGSCENSCTTALFAYHVSFFYKGKKSFTVMPKNEFPWSLFWDDISKIPDEC